MLLIKRQFKGYMLNQAVFPRSYRHVVVMCTAEGSNLQHLQIITRGLTFSLPQLPFILFQTPLSLPSLLSLHLPAMCCDCISRCASPHSESFHFRAEPSSHRRYWNLLPKQLWGWTLVLCWILLMCVYFSQCVYACVQQWEKVQGDIYFFNVFCFPLV